MAIPVQHAAVLGICRKIFFDRPANHQPRVYRFLAANVVNVEWWTTTASRSQMKALAMSALKEPGLVNGDIDTFTDVFTAVLSGKLTDSTLFDFSQLRGRKPAGTVFDLIASTIDKPAFAARIYAEFVAACRDELCVWLTIYPLRKIYAPTSLRPIGGVRLIASLDDAEWIKLGVRFPELGQFQPPFAIFQGHRLSGDFDPSAPGNLNFDTQSVWAVSEHTGTARGALKRARADIAVFIAVLFAHVATHPSGIWTKGGADRDHRCLQVSKAASRSNAYFVTALGELMPPLMNAFTVDAKLLAAVDAWYAKLSGHANAQRANTAASFLHHAIRADGIERYIHLFVVVDALFGERNKVEVGVLAGIAKVFPGDAEWQARCAELYGLRNAVVHGACSDVDQWSGIEDYVRQFEAWPTDDAIEMATAALRAYLDLPIPVPEKPRPYHSITRPIAQFFSTVSRRLHVL